MRHIVRAIAALAVVAAALGLPATAASADCIPQQTIWVGPIPVTIQRFCVPPE